MPEAPALEYSSAMNSAVLFNIFNRPELARLSFAAIRQARPPRLYIAADGPRAGREEEEDLCRQARSIAEEVDWPCQVKTLFRKRNLGCKIACSSAISWFFQQEQEGVILEDDCVAHPDFFPYCEELLERYRDEPKVMLISGSNFEFGKRRGEASYFFSMFPHIWGWAGWASRWKLYDVNMAGSERYIHTRMLDDVGHEAAYRIMARKFWLISNGYDDTWDYQLVYAVWKNQGLCVIPNVNMIRNIGFIEESAHPAPPDIRMVRSVSGMGTLTHPATLIPDAEAHRFACETLACDKGGFEDILLREGLRRLDAGEHEANKELIRCAREFYGPLQGFLGLEALHALALGDMPAAQSAYAELRLRYPEDPLIAALAAPLGIAP